MTEAHSVTTDPRRAPLLGTMMQELTRVRGRDARRCHAIIDNTDHRCRKVYHPKIHYIKKTIRQACKSPLPFDKSLSGKLTSVLLCFEHRHQKDHSRPLRHAFSSMPPGCDLTSFSHARTQLLNVGKKLRCIASNGPGERCAYTLDKNTLDAARKIVRSSFEHGSEDEEKEEVLAGLSELKPLICLLLCPWHLHWFWLDLYNDTWAEEITRNKLASSESSESSDESSESNEGSSETNEESSEASDESSQASDDSHRKKSSKACSSSSSPPIGATQESSDEEEGTTQLEIDGPSSVAEATATVNVNINYYFLSASQEALDRALDRLPAVSARAPASSPSTPQGSRHPRQHPAHTAPASSSFLAPEAQGRGVHERLPGRTKPLPDRRRRSAPASRATTSASPLPSPDDRAARRDPYHPKPGGRPSTARPTSSTTAAEALAESVRNLSIAGAATPTKPPPRRRADGGARQWPLAGPFAVLPRHLVCVVEKKLGKELRNQLGPNDTLGDVYVLESAALPGLIKIGVAADSHGRLREIRERCKLSDLEMAYVEVNVPHPKRVEKLVHVQLQELRQLRGCDAERVTHKEWYRCKADFASTVVKAWAGWMRRRPYAHGVLQSPWGARVQDLMEDPMLEEDETFVEVFERHRRWMVQQP